MDFRRLRYFITVAEEGHITRAAARLGIQQPPLTQQMQALEREIGTKLLIRTPRGVTLTAAGAALASDGRTILEASARAVQRARQVAQGQAGVLSIGFTTSAVLHPLVPTLLRAFRTRYPAIQLDVQESAAAQLIESVFRGALKAAILRLPVTYPPGVAFVELLQEPMMAVLPEDHALAKGSRNRAVALRALEQEAFILVRQPGGTGLYQNVVLACRRAGFEPTIGAEVPHMLTAINLVAAGTGVTFVPRSMEEVSARRVAYRPLQAAENLVAPLTLATMAASIDPVLLNFVAVASETARPDHTGPDWSSQSQRARRR